MGAAGTKREDTELTITHEPENHRFVALADDGKRMGAIVYEERDGALRATHTWTDEAYRGRGVAGKMLDELVAHAEERGMKIVPVCSYVVAAFERHPERYRAVTQ